MNREQAIQAISDQSTVWDCLIIGGGATGLGCALDAASRGYQTLLVEKHDFAKGTSSRSTKLVHGGVRYLEQGNIQLVRHALQERGLLLKNAPHLAHPLKFVIPAYAWWQLPFYGAGLGAYDLLAGKLSLGRSQVLGREQTINYLPNVETRALKGGILYFDGQFDDARLAVTLLRTLADQKGWAANHAEVVSLTKAGQRVTGAIVRDRETGVEHPVKAKVVINATGVFVDQVRAMDRPADRKILAAAQGSHLVLPRHFLRGNAALMVPKTSDGRVLFAIPWHDRAVVGTTDFGVPGPQEEPRIQRHEVDFILTEAARYFERDPSESDVLATYSGLRPLVKSGEGSSTAGLSRDHTVLISPGSLVTITGGKWTTYRRMGEDGINHAAQVAGLPFRPSRTANLPLHGKPADASRLAGSPEHLSVYGSDRPALEALAHKVPGGRDPLHPRLPYWKAEVYWAIRQEMARTVEDVLSRRTRALLLDVQAAVEAARTTGDILGAELGRPKTWVDDQVKAFETLAQAYRLPSR
ncbi:MAG: glycerol-3-phosphate dehydrogenase/oxidase [Verrucomicrobia bacterium]|nr:glycerol-3-phosphate dehydrogenase/oxidase [Verrucomicrobiota bacterium]